MDTDPLAVYTNTLDLTHQKLLDCLGLANTDDRRRDLLSSNRLSTRPQNKIQTRKIIDCILKMKEVIL